MKLVHFNKSVDGEGGPQLEHKMKHAQYLLQLYYPLKLQINFLGAVEKKVSGLFCDTPLFLITLENHFIQPQVRRSIPSANIQFTPSTPSHSVTKRGKNKYAIRSTR
jgi:hypothetical protein